MTNYTQSPKAERTTGADEVVSHIRSGMRVFVHGACMTPTALLDALGRRTDLEGVRLYHLHLAGPLAFLDPKHAGRITSVSLFTGAGLRGAIAEGRAEYIPIFLSDIAPLFRSGGVKLDAALVSLSTPDRHGYCTLGTSVDVARAAVDSAPMVLAEVNARAPRTHGDSAFDFDHVRAFCEVDRPLHEHPREPESTVTATIGEIVADLVDDGACLQVGIGGIPDAVLARLKHRRDLGVHTEMFSDGMVDLFEAGAISNRFKEVHPGRMTTAFVAGTKRVFDFVNDNPLVHFYGADRTNDTALIRKNPKVVAVNSAIEIDLTGQVCADSMGHAIFSGIGGQMDFIRGAALSKGGKAIIALPSTAGGGSKPLISRITPELKPGAGVVTTRGHVQWIATEYGAANLHGLSLRQRGEALVSLAHPDFRPMLRDKLVGLKRFVM
jgi:acyl-CoA hydrolase